MYPESVKIGKAAFNAWGGQLLRNLIVLSDKNEYV
jgi:hypothetical protein